MIDLVEMVIGWYCISCSRRKKKWTRDISLVENVQRFGFEPIGKDNLQELILFP